jgi:serine protease AprX
MFGSNMRLASSTGDNSYVTKSGTSFACPYVAGLGCLVFEGIVRGAEAQGFLSNLLTGSMILPKMDYVIGNMMPQICVKPDDVDLDKDNFYGYGLAFGPLAKAQFAAQANNMVDAMKIAMPAFMMSAFAMALPVKVG